MRNMTLADIDTVLHIEQSVQAYPWSLGNFTDALINGYVCCVDEQDGEICSYAVLMMGVDEAELLTIGVAASQQRRGLGRSILNGMLAMAQEKNRQRVFLEVRSSNAAAIALYRKVGFSEVGLRRGYYQNKQGREDAVVMALDLPSPPAPLPQAGEGSIGNSESSDSSLPQAGERLGERANG
ncbi:MAG: ribosomal protein S18-alanine N-acetyltransferase [Gallionella sp.]|nr:ribosomal protein S18-alanine N-acetyltransferase [Gallionella sp.]